MTGEGKKIRHYAYIILLEKVYSLRRYSLSASGVARLSSVGVPSLRPYN